MEINCESIEKLEAMDSVIDIVRLCATVLKMNPISFFGNSFYDDDIREFFFYFSIIREIAIQSIIRSNELKNHIGVRKSGRTIETIGKKAGKEIKRYKRGIDQMSQSAVYTLSLNYIKTKVNIYSFLDLIPHAGKLGVYGIEGSKPAQKQFLIKEIVKTVGKRLVFQILNE